MMESPTLTMSVRVWARKQWLMLGSRENVCSGPYVLADARLPAREKGRILTSIASSACCRIGAVAR